MFSLSQVQEFSIYVWLGLAVAAALAGFMDAVVGGGGMIQVPAAFAALPTQLPATVLGTNKLAGIFGTGAAVIEYTKKIKPPWDLVGLAAGSACLAAVLGARSVSYFPAEQFKKVLPFILLVLLIYVLVNKNLGQSSQHRVNNWVAKILAIFWGAVIGFYDGVFGPGTGSFLVFMWVRGFGFEFLTASCAAKVVNFSCNLGALFWFGFSGSIIVVLALTMAVFNILGAVIGSRIALKQGSHFVRKIFIVVVLCLILKTFYTNYV